MPPRRDTVEKARKLRQEMSLPEVRLWQYLRTRPDGLKFRRQYPAGPYVLDFYCAVARLGIEIDGAIHDGRQAEDARRDAWLRERGLRILRVRAADVLADLDSVVRLVLAECRAIPLHPRPAVGGPPPHR